MTNSPLNEFMKAIEIGDANKVQALLSHGSVDANARVPRFAAPVLVFATIHGHKEVVRVLLSAGAHVDNADTAGRTACYCAAVHGHADVLAVLLAHQPPPNLAAAASDGLAPLDIAIRHSREHIVQLLIAASAPLSNRDSLCKCGAVEHQCHSGRGGAWC